MLIGVGERKDGLYYFRRVSRVKTLKINGAYSLGLWHKLVGHPSMRITKLVPTFGSSRNSKMLNKACDVCQRAKHTRDEFPLSDHKVGDVFQLIHYDLWGAYKAPSY